MKTIYVCTNCGFKGDIKKIMKGGLGTEIVLWLVFFPAGILYSIWRSSTKYWGCPGHGNRDSHN